MIKSLRKRHLQIWILWAVLLPAGIVVAWKAIPKNARQELINIEQAEALSLELDHYDQKLNYHTRLSTNPERTRYQLSWVASGLSAGFTSPNVYRRNTFLIYCITDSGRELIGRIGGHQGYRFNLPEVSFDTYTIIIYDPFKKKDIRSLALKKTIK